MALEVGGSSPLGHPTCVKVLEVWGNIAVGPDRAISEPSFWLADRLGERADSCASSSMAEQRTLNPQVLGSNPRGRTPTNPTPPTRRGTRASGAPGAGPPCGGDKEAGLRPDGHR